MVSDVSFSCFKVKCYLEGCIEVMVFGEKFLLNVGAAKTADKAVVKGLREIFPKLTSGSQSLEVGHEFGYTLVFCLLAFVKSVSFHNDKFLWSKTVLQYVFHLRVRLSRRRSIGEEGRSITEIRMARLLCLPLSSAGIILFATKYCSRRSMKRSML